MPQPLRIGPMEPDEFAGLGGPSGLRDARAAIEAAQQAHPPELRAAQQKPRDEEATAKLNLSELSDHFGVDIVAASVRGVPGTEQVLLYLFRTESGRTARWWAPVSDVGPAEIKADEAQQEREEAEQQAEPEPTELPPDEQEQPGAEEPWSGYDSESVAEIQAQLAQNPDADLKRRVREYETAHKARRGVLNLVS